MTLADVRSEVDHRVGGRKIEATEIERITGRGVAQPLLGRCQSLVQIERVQRTAAGVAAQHDAVETLAHRGHARGDVEQHHLVQQGRVVVEPPAVLAEHRVAPLDEPGHRVVVREVGAWVHQADDGVLAAA